MGTTSQISWAALCVLLFGCGRSHDADMPADAAVDDGGTVGDGGQSAKCPSAPACGGDLVGTWSVTSTCLDVDVSSYTADCDSSKAHAVGYKITGTLTYDADLSFSLSTAMSGSVVLELPAPCLTPPNGAQISCAQLEPALLAPGKYQSVRCVVRSGGGCVCTFAPNPQMAIVAGTYSTTEPGVLTETDSTGVTDVIDFCATDGANVTFSPPPHSAMLALEGLASGSLTLTKQ